MKNKAQEVKAKIEELTSKKRSELEEIQKKKEEASKQLEAANNAIYAATEKMDLEEFEAAKADKRKARTALDMYTGRYIQIQKQEYITDEESEKVIEELLAYEEELADNFKTATTEAIRVLIDLQENYKKDVAETEQTIIAWTNNIHANYINPGTVYRETGTNRSPHPIPVHKLPYRGCKESLQLEDYLKNVADIAR